MYQFIVVGLALMALAFPGAGRSETVYVIDKLLAGLYQDKSYDSPLVKVFPTGTAIEVVKWDGNFAQVRGPGGETGWMDSQYLMRDLPARSVVDRFEKANKELESEVKDLRKKLEETSRQPLAGGNANPQNQGEPTPQVAELREENETLKKQVSTGELKIKELEIKLASAEASTASGTSPRRAELEEELARLKEDLDAARANADMGPTLLEGKLLIYLIVIGVVLVAAFLGGVYWMDFLHRRRHGGFRV